MPTEVLRILAVADTSAAQAKLGMLQGKMQAVSKSGTGAAGMMSAAWKTFGLAAGLAVVAVGVKAVKAASDLGESINKVRVIFGTASSSVLQFAKDAEKIGLAEAQALDAAAGLGAMAQSAGLTNAASAKMSITLVKLAADMASFNNQDPGEMLERMRAGLAGEAEPLRRFGIFLSEGRVKTEAYRMGIAKLGSTLTDAQKVQARFNVIMQDTKKQQGDFARTVGTSLPNQIRVLSATMENLAAELGQNLLPVLLQLTKALNDFAQALGPVLKGVGMASKLIGPLAKGPFTDLGDAINAVANKDLPELGKQFLDSFIPFDIWKKKAGEAAKVTPEMTRAWANAGREFARMSSGLTEIIPEYDAVAARTHTLAQGQRILAEAHRTAAAGAREQLLAENTLAGVLLGIQSASLQAKGATQDLRDARKELADLEKKGKRGTDEYREAVNGLREAELRATESQLSLSTAVNSYVQELVASGQSQSVVIEKVRAFAKQAGLTKGETDALIKTVQGLITKYQGVPKTVQTNLKVIGANEVIDKINQVRRAMFLLDGSTATTFVRTKGGFVPAQHGFDGIVRQPTAFLTGEKNLPEHVKITPLTGGGGSRAGAGSSGLTIIFQGPIYGMPDFKRQVVRVVDEAVLDRVRL